MCCYPKVLKITRKLTPVQDAGSAKMLKLTKHLHLNKWTDGIINLHNNNSSQVSIENLAYSDTNSGTKSIDFIKTFVCLLLSLNVEIRTEMSVGYDGISLEC